MNNILKSWKTTTVAIVGLLLGIATFIFWFIGKVDNDGLSIGLSGVGTFTVILLGLFAKDNDQSHSLNPTSGDHPDPKKEEK